MIDTCTSADMIGVLILLLFTTDTRVNAMSEADVMWEFHLALDDASNMSPFDGWTQNDDACDIQNVHCVDNTIRKILFSADVVSGSPIIGTLTPHLQYLADLEVIDLSDQQMHGELPSEWSAISTLIELSDLKNQEMHGTLPEAWSSLTQLTTVRLGNNELTGTLPSAWKDLANLNDLILTGNLLSGSIPPSWSVLNFDSFAVWGNQHLCGELPDGFADVDTTDTNLNALCPWTENPVPAPVSELDSISSVDAEESVEEPFISPQGEALGSGAAPEEETLEPDPGLEDDYSSIGAPSSFTASEPEEKESVSILPPEGHSPDILHEEARESEIAPAREPSSLVSTSSVDGSASASDTLEESVCYEDIELIGPIHSNSSLTVVYITGSVLEREQCDIHCFVEVFVDTNATVIGVEQLQNGAIKIQVEARQEGVSFMQYSPSVLCQMDEATQRLEVVFDFSSPKVVLTLEDIPGDLKSTFKVLVNFSEEVSLANSGLSEILTLTHGTVLSITQKESLIYTVEIQGVSGMESSISIANGSYTDLAGNVGSGAFLTVFVPKVLDSVITRTVDHVVLLSPALVPGSITLALLTSALSSGKQSSVLIIGLSETLVLVLSRIVVLGSTSIGIQSFSHLQILALVGHLSLPEVPQSFVKSAGGLNWSLLDFDLPWKLSDLSTSMEDSVKENVLHTTSSRRLASVDDGIPNEILEDWTTIEQGIAEALFSSTTEAVESLPQTEKENEEETIGALFWKQLVLLSMALVCVLILQTSPPKTAPTVSENLENAQKQLVAFPSLLLAVFLTGVPVLMFSCTRLLSEDHSSVDTKISLTVFSIALLASVALFCFETRKRVSHKKITPLERVTSVPEDTQEDTRSEASEISLLTNSVQQRARILDPKVEKPPDCYSQEQDWNEAVAEQPTASSDCSPCSPKADPSITKRPQNRWTSIEYQRKAQNKLLSFIKSATGIADSKQDEEIREDVHPKSTSKPLEVPRIETCLPSISKEGLVNSVEESLNASPRSQHFLERCSSPDESPLLSARDPQIKSPLVSTSRRDSLTSDEALLEQPQSMELQQTPLELPRDRSLSPAATWIPVLSPRHSSAATSVLQREQTREQNAHFISLDFNSEVLFWSISLLRRCMIAFLVGFESFGANHKIIMLTITQILYTFGLFFAKGYPNHKLEHFCSFLETGILVSLAIIHWTGDPVITYPLLGCLIGEILLIIPWLVASSLIQIKNSLVCCKGPRIVSN